MSLGDLHIRAPGACVTRLGVLLHLLHSWGDDMNHHNVFVQDKIMLGWNNGATPDEGIVPGGGESKVASQQTKHDANERKEILQRKTLTYHIG